MSENEHFLIIDGLQKATDQACGLDHLPIHRLESIMSKFNDDQSWKERALKELKTISDEQNIQFNLNTNIGRLVLCDYPQKLVISSPIDPNNTTGKTLVTRGSFLKENKYVEEKLKSAKAKLTETADGNFLGMYGQLGFDTREQSELAEEQIKILISGLKGHIKGIVTSGSLLGIGGIGHKIAKSQELKTVGILPQTATHKADPGRFDVLIVEGEDWGESSFMFGGIADIIIFMGGGYWSYLEYKYAKLFNKNVTLVNQPNLRYSKEFTSDNDAKKDLNKKLAV